MTQTLSGCSIYARSGLKNVKLVQHSLKICVIFVACYKVSAKENSQVECFIIEKVRRKRNSILKIKNLSVFDYDWQMQLLQVEDVKISSSLLRLPDVFQTYFLLLTTNDGASTLKQFVNQLQYRWSSPMKYSMSSHYRN